MLSEREKQLSEWVQKALTYADMKQADLSRALIQSGLRTIDRSAVNKVVLGTRKLSANEMLEISRITDYPTPDRRIGASKIKQEQLPPPPEHRGPPTHKQADASEQAIPHEQREARLLALFAKVLEAQGTNAAVAERLASAIAKVADMPLDLRDGALDEGQIQREARLLVALFDTRNPL